MKRKSLYLAMASLLSVVVGGNASAAFITLDGDGFKLVYDDAAVNLFGAPTLSGDGKSVLFSPLNFKATSSSTTGFVTANSNAQFDLLLDDGQALKSVSLIENGDYRLINSGGTSNPEVDVSGELRLTNLFTATDFVTENFSAGALTTTCTTLSNCPLNQWTATKDILAPDTWGGVDVRVRLQNDLTAASFDVQDLAQIEKKHASQTVQLTPELIPEVPVPAAIWLFGSALAGLVGVRRKKQSL